jgi:hypothetical protein
MVNDELHISEAVGLTPGKLDAEQVDAIGGNDGLGRMNHRNVQRKAPCKYPFLAHQLSVFSASANNRMVQIAYSSSEVVSQTTSTR